MKLFRRLENEESGQALILVALMMVILLGFGALVVDVGYMRWQKISLQTAADSAALAGAMSIPELDDIKVKGVTVSFAQANIEGAAQIVPSVNRAEGTATVVITQEVPKFFSRILTDQTFSITVTATAVYKGNWDGEALPFVNLDDSYTVGHEIELWEKLGQGDFEYIIEKDNGSLNHGFDAVNTQNKDSGDPYFKIRFDQGIELAKGLDAKYSKPLEDITAPGSTVYMFSLSNQAISTNKYTDLKNKDIISFSDLVLLKAQVISVDFNGSDPRIVLKVQQVYNIPAGEYPEDYVNPDSVIPSKLIR